MAQSAQGRVGAVTTQSGGLCTTEDRLLALSRDGTATPLATDLSEPRLARTAGGTYVVGRANEGLDVGGATVDSVGTFLLRLCDAQLEP